MTFAHREVLGAAVVAIAFVVAMYGYDRARRRQLSRRLGELPVIGRAMATASPGRRAAKAVMFGMAIVLACVALARPQVDGDRTIESRGLDAVVALDVSKSMMVDDVGQTRDMAATTPSATVQLPPRTSSRSPRANSGMSRSIRSRNDSVTSPTFCARGFRRSGRQI